MSSALIRSLEVPGFIPERSHYRTIETNAKVEVQRGFQAPDLTVGLVGEDEGSLGSLAHILDSEHLPQR